MAINFFVKIENKKMPGKHLIKKTANGSYAAANGQNAA
jgi:hypothetical protein